MNWDGLLPDTAQADIATGTISLMHAMWPVTQIVLVVLLGVGIVSALIYAMKHH